jgi:hypothetical protein
LNNAARVAANFAAQNPTAWNVGNPNPAVQAEYVRLVTTETAGMGCTLDAVQPPTIPNATVIGSPARATVSCRFTLLTPLIGAILPNPVPVTAAAAFPVRSGAIAGIPVQTAAPLPTPSPSPTNSPTPSPSGSASPSSQPTPTATPMCVVPQLVGVASNQVQNRWTHTAGFKTNVIFSPLIPPQYAVGSQSLTAGSSLPCDTTTITVSP